MKIGDILRQRNIRAYGSGDCRNWFEFSADRERKRERKRVFVTMLLGMEMMDLSGSEALDPAESLNALGWWGEDQLIAALGREKAEEIVRLMSRNPSEKSSEARRQHDAGGEG